MEILKEKTRSICPECLRELDARVTQEGKEVFLEKNCPEHGNFKFLIEKDAELYKKIMNVEFAGDRISFKKLTLPVTHQCNLNCQVCYSPDRERKDPSLQELKKIMQDFQGDLIKITGGEATLNPNLPSLIEIAKESGKSFAVVTNGIKLVDINYARILKQAGLKYLAVAFSGFSDEVCERIYGGRILKEKLKALRNLKKLGMKVSLSVTLARGINDQELVKIYKYYLKNRSFIKKIRIRTLSYIGKYVKTSPFCLSEIIELLSGVTGFNRNELIEPNLKNYSKYRATCRFKLNLFDSFNYRLLKKRNKSRILNKVRFVFDSIRFFGLRNAIELIINKIIGQARPPEAIIEIRIWPDKQRLDLGEMQHCLTATVSGDKTLLPFCYAIIMDEKKRF